MNVFHDTKVTAAAPESGTATAIENLAGTSATKAVANAVVPKNAAPTKKAVKPAAPKAIKTKAPSAPLARQKSSVPSVLPKSSKAAKPAVTAPPSSSKVASTGGVVTAPAAVAKPPAKPRLKLVRDSFTMPIQDFALIAVLKDRALDFKRPTKKSELLRAGLQALAALKPAEFQQALGKLAPLKAGRPKKLG